MTIYSLGVFHLGVCQGVSCLQLYLLFISMF